MIVLVEVTGYTDASTAVVYRYATAGYTTSPSDTPASTYYAPRVSNPGEISRRLSDGTRNNPRAEISFGRIELINEGELDSIFASGSVSFRERPVRVLMVEEGAAYSTATVLLSAVVAQVELSAKAVLLSIKDASYLLASPHQTSLYGGTNSLPAGVDGVDDLKGKEKPKLYGKAYKIPAPCVNTSKLIYQVSDRAGVSVDACYEGGDPLSAGAAYSSQADMETNAPSSGQYRVWLATDAVFVRVTPGGGASPVYDLTFDATGDSSANSTPAQLLKRLALDRGWDAGDISSSDVTALDALSTAVCGVWINDSRSTLDAMDLVARSAGAVYWVDRLGDLRMAQLALPSGDGVDILASWKVVSLTQTMTGEDVPVGTVRIKYAHYETTQSRSQIAGTVSDATAEDLAQEWRVATYTASPSPNPHKRLLVTERDTALTAKSAAETEAQRLHGLTAAPRRTHVALGVQLTTSSVLAVDLNSVITVRWDRYGFDSETPVPRRVIGMTTYLRDLRCDLTLWGA